MKKRKILFSITLISSLILTPLTSPAITHAVGTTTSSANEETASVKVERDKVIDKLAEAKTYVDYAKYNNSFVDTLQLFITQIEEDIAKGEDYGTFVKFWTDNYNILVNNIELVKNAPLAPTTTSTKESSESSHSSTQSSTTDASTTNSSSSDSSSSTSSSSESSSSSSSSDSSSSTSSSSESSSSSSSSDSSSSTSSSIDTTNMIEVSDQTMYVGQKITEDLVMSWAKFNNLKEEYFYGFNVLDEEIEISNRDLLLNTGTHTIEYFVVDPEADEEDDFIIALKEITLTVLPEKKNPVVIKPVVPITTQKVTPIKTTNTLVPATNKTISSTKQLPKTGETKNNLLTLSLGTSALAGALYLFSNRQRKDEFSI
ncbi:LPXTG cell wall anchor domain-containing protein [Vagococcus hydrophili]|uniref:LPXTG cell wall anchor domain-containing protein n=1 Tax=Vagococcus hydrophili TaxID=2714947 RepID=A0A6G8ASS4_9ENTE|nr:LPXTG cell wall anchor domain-containing protein [Vagococcus hydrophili]QIL48128.1 LPXTG cell wall anchor domain-containing protein [Vagococcus hydrophili]